MPFLACFSLANTRADAPSFIPDAFPAVTEPSFLKTVFKLDNDSIVVSDRIRENFLDENKKGSSEVLLNDSLNQVFARTIITSFTTLLVLIALLVAGGEALKNFSLALAAGVVVGSYSSIFIVVRVLMLTGLSKKDMEKPKNEPEESYSLD